MLQLKILLTVYFFIVGLCIGSFLNVVAWRLPRKLPIAKGRSMCPQCGHTLGALDLVPVFSFLFLGGKCRYCKAPISWRYPASELLTGAAFGFAGWCFGLSMLPYAVVLCLYFSALLIAWFIDREETYIPDRVHLIILAAAVASWFCGPAVSLPERLLGGAGAGLVMLLISRLTGGGIGGGDIKLMTASGLLLGWKLILPAFFFAYILALLRYLIPLLQKKLAAGQEIPMAPFFALSLMVFSLYGQPLLDWYLGRLG